MVKLVFCCRRLPHLTRAEFQRYWRETHGPLVQRHADTLGIRRYVQTHTLDHPANAALAQSRDAPEAFEINRQKVANVSQINRELQKIQNGQVAFLLIWRDGNNQFVTMTKR